MSRALANRLIRILAVVYAVVALGELSTGIAEHGRYTLHSFWLDDLNCVCANALLAFMFWRARWTRWNGEEDNS